MKITNSKNQQITTKKAGQKAKIRESGFFDLLAGQLEGPAATSPTQETSALLETQQLPPQIRLNGLKLSESSIDLLDNFRKAVANLDLSAADLAPLIDALEGDTTAMLDIKAQLPTDDPLARLIDQVATISYIETEKFRRGDYN